VGGPDGSGIRHVERHDGQAIGVGGPEGRQRSGGGRPATGGEDMLAAREIVPGELET
jgi:hypothetical protein